MTLEEARVYAKDYKVVPVSEEILSDVKTPMEVLRILKKVSSHCFMLESAENQERWGRYTFIGFDPVMEITCTDGRMTIRQEKAGQEQTETREVSHPGEILRKLLCEYKSPKIEGLPSFTGGLVGYFSYDYVKYSEPTLNLDAADEEGFRDVDLMLFDKVIAFDNVRQKIIVIVNAKTEHLEESYEKAVAEIKKMISLIKTGEPMPIVPGKIKSGFRSLFGEAEYCSMIEKAKGYI